MKEIYMVTGAAGHLGNVVARTLVERGFRVWIFLLVGEENRVEGVEEIFFGDVRDKKTIEKMFVAAGEDSVTMIHCAGIVSIQSHYSQQLYDVNVNGTKNITDLCVKYQVKKMVYTSSVHAIAEEKEGILIKETEHFDPDEVVGYYAKTKAEATKYVLEARDQGLCVNVVHPSGIIGPYDFGNGHMTTMIVDYCNNRLLAGMSGGYDFVDVRDVAEGILACCEQGKPGACYILSNNYYTIKELLGWLSEFTGKKKIRYFLPLWFVKLTALLAEFYYKRRQQAPLFTSYSIYTLMTNIRYSHEKATMELGYQPRDMTETLKDTITWLKEQNRIS